MIRTPEETKKLLVFEYPGLSDLTFQLLKYTGGTDPHLMIKINVLEDSNPTCTSCLFRMGAPRALDYYSTGIPIQTVSQEQDAGCVITRSLPKIRNLGSKHILSIRRKNETRVGKTQNTPDQTTRY